MLLRQILQFVTRMFGRILMEYMSFTSLRKCYEYKKNPTSMNYASVIFIFDDIILCE